MRVGLNDNPITLQRNIDRLIMKEFMRVGFKDEDVKK